MEYEILNLDIKNKFIGKKILRYKTISSTQEKSLYLVKNCNNTSNLNGIVIVSDFQTDGKGRLNRRWISSPGGLWFSIILVSPNIHVLDINYIHMLSTLSVCETINIFIDSKAVIKWPNDILIGSKKISGILIDLSITEEKIDYIVIGIGINVNTDTIQIRKEIEKEVNINNNFNIDMYNDVTSIKDEIKAIQVDKLKLLSILLEKLERYFLTINRSMIKAGDNDDYLINQNKSKIIETYKRLCNTIGKRIRIHIKGKEEYSGLATGLDEDGYLILKREGNGNKNTIVEKLYYGDISIRDI